MAFSHGKAAVIKIDNAAGTLTDISNVSNAGDLSNSLGTGETTSFGQGDKTFIAGLREGTFSIGGSYDNNVDKTIKEMIDAIANGTLATMSLEYYPAGNTTGKVKYACENIPTSYTVSTPVGGVSTFKLDLQRTGALDQTVVA
jgi:hypothetical protein